MEKRSKKLSEKKVLTRGQKGTRKWLVEGLVIICGAFMDTLLGSLDTCEFYLFIVIVVTVSALSSSH